MTTIREWHGSDKELLRLRAAIERNCTCPQGGPPQPACQAHAMLTDQNVLDHLLYVYRSRQTYVSRELDEVA